MIRVLIADDSAFMRKILCDLFNEQKDFEVVGTAINGKDTIDKIKKFNPDVVTLDVTMPVMDGLEALSIIMKECPVPVVMFSSMTQRGTDATVRALSLGAVDFISKAGGSISKIDNLRDEILTKCREAALAHVDLQKFPAQLKTSISARTSPLAKTTSKISTTSTVSTTSKLTMQPKISIQNTLTSTNNSTINNAVNVSSTTNDIWTRRKTEFKQKEGLKLGQKPIIKHVASTLNSVVTPLGTTSKKLVAIGTSTGGPQALKSVITKLPADLPCGVVVVQHMPAGFTKSLAERLDSISAISVKEAENDEIIKDGQVYIAPGNYHMRVAPAGAGQRKIVLSQEPPVGNHRPAVNVLFDSVAQFKKDLISVIMTGMGCDGCEGMKKIKANGGYCIAQDEPTCIVYGMPKAVVDAGLSDEIRPLSQIASAIVEAVSK